jgi:hypothetical protein
MNDPVKQLFGIEEPVEPEEPHFENELAYLEYVWRDPTKPDRLRYMAAKACADFHFPSLRAVAHVNNKDSLAAMIDRSRERAARYTNVIKLEIEQKALSATQHDPAELKPDATSAANGGQSSSGFRRRILSQLFPIDDAINAAIKP